MKIIGICGSSGSGKSTVCSILAGRGVPVLDCDVIYHELVDHPSHCLHAIAERFGNSMIRDGKLDRAALRKVVFSDPAALNDLNRISHYYVKEELRDRCRKLKENGEEVVAIDAPMLFEANLETWCDVVCAVVADPLVQIRRICARDGITPEDARLRVLKQTPSEILRERADFILENNGSAEELSDACDRLLEYTRSTERKKRHE